ncbi:hypothetical protein BH23ACT10_BH23ACT10_05800 [soil metagenome]
MSPPAPDGDDRPRSGDGVRATRGRGRDLAVVSVAGVVGLLVVAALVGGWFSAPDDQVTADVRTAIDADDDTAANTDDADAAAAGDGVAGDGAGSAGADSPTAAVEGFLSAEVDGQLADAFGYLSTDDRETFGSAAEWVAVHADALPPVTGYTVADVDADGDRAQITGTVAFEPGLDQVLGLVRPQADVTWTAVRDTQGDWGVDLTDSELLPVYPDDDQGAVDAAQRWAQARQQCRTEGEWDGGLVGSPALADALCGTDGPVEVGQAAALDDIDAPAFNAAFGPDVGMWTRVVTVTAPVPVRVALAPIGDRWEVIGVMRDR